MQADEQTLGWLFSTLERMHQGCRHSLMRAKGLEEISHPHLLFHIYKSDQQQQQCLAQRDLAEMMGISAASVAVSLKRMEKSGLLERSADDADTRRNHVYLTDKGRTLCARALQAARDLDAQIFADFSAEERATMYGYYLRMAENLQTLGAQAPSRLLQALEEEQQA